MNVESILASNLSNQLLKDIPKIIVTKQGVLHNIVGEFKENDIVLVVKIINNIRLVEGHFGRIASLDQTVENIEIELRKATVDSKEMIFIFKNNLSCQHGPFDTEPIDYTKYFKKLGE